MDLPVAVIVMTVALHCAAHTSRGGFGAVFSVHLYVRVFLSTVTHLGADQVTPFSVNPMDTEIPTL